MATCTLSPSHAESPLAPDQRVEQIKRVMQLEIALAELRGSTEREIDVVQLPAFQRYVEALGVKLEIQAIFDDVDVTDVQLSGCGQ